MRHRTLRNPQKGSGAAVSGCRVPARWTGCPCFRTAAARMQPVTRTGYDRTFLHPLFLACGQRPEPAHGRLRLGEHHRDDPPLREPLPEVGARRAGAFRRALPARGHGPLLRALRRGADGLLPGHPRKPLGDRRVGDRLHGPCALRYGQNIPESQPPRPPAAHPPATQPCWTLRSFHRTSSC